MRFVALFALLAAEAALAVRAIDTDLLIGHSAWWVEPVRTLSHNVPIAACIVAVVALLGAGRWRAAFDAIHLAVPTRRDAALALFGHGAYAAVFAALTALLLAGGSTVALVQHVLPFAWFASAGASLACVLLAVAPASAWRRGFGPLAPTIALGACAGAALYGVGAWIDGNYFLWSPLADVTLQTSAWFVGLFASDVFLDTPERILGTGNFRVIVTKYCSGLEGLALFGLFFGSFLVLARRHVRLARAAWLLPLGMLLVWFFNAARIAALIALGSYVDPELAVDAFHTHAGWPPLIGVALGCVALATRVDLFRRVDALRTDQRAASVANTAPDGTAAYLVPLLAVVATTLVAGAFLDRTASAAPLRVLVGAVLLWRLGHARPRPRIDFDARVALLAIAALGTWLALDPSDPAATVPPEWLTGAVPLVAALWWCSAALGYVVITPIVEELAFRGYLQRRLVQASFEELDYRRPAPLAVLGSALAFGLLHHNWLGGLAVGVLCSAAAARRNRLSDAIVVHAAVNLALLVLAVATGHYGHWF